MTHELLWVSSVFHLVQKFGGKMDGLVAAGVTEVILHLTVSADTRSAMDQISRLEGRKGWSSKALTDGLGQFIVDRVQGDPDSLPEKSRRGSVHFALDQEQTAALVAKLAPADPHPSLEPQARQQAHEAAKAILRELGSQEASQAAQQGMDMRWAALRTLATAVGDGLGLGEPRLTPMVGMASRPSPDDRALVADRRLRERVAAFQDRFSQLPQLVFEPLGVVRCQPRGVPWTAVALILRLPATPGFVASWSVDSQAG